MPQIKLTDARVPKLEVAPGKKTTDYQDALEPHLYLRVGMRTRTWYAVYSLRKRRWDRLGSHPSLSVSSARKAAAAASQMALDRVDPRDPHGEETLLYPLIDRYLSSGKERWKKEFYRSAELSIERIKDTVGNVPVPQLTKRMIAASWRDYPVNVQARLYTVWKGVLTRAVGIEFMVDHHPMIGMIAPQHTRARDRWLSQEEIRSVWEACEYLDNSYTRMVQFSLLLAGAGRRQDIAAAHSDQLSSYPINGVEESCLELVEPTKSDRAHIIPLAPWASEFVKQGYFFPGKYGGQVSGFAKMKAKLDSYAGIEPWRYHDIRRTASTHFADYLEMEPWVIERVQNRKSGDLKGVVRVYNRALYMSEKMRALTVWEGYLKGVVSPRDTGEA